MGSIAKLVLRYTMPAVAAAGISSEGVKAEFEQDAEEEQEHMMAVAERINQLGGKPDFNPTGVASRAASEYGDADNLSHGPPDIEQSCQPQ
jgi:bacterioferritin